MTTNPYASPVWIDAGGKAIVLSRVPLAATNAVSTYNEDWLQGLLYRHPEALPIGEIDQSFLNLVPICRELNTPVGPIDVLYATPTGRLVALEAKLWRNPEARRKVIGQILDYAKELSRWSYDDLQREVARATRTETGADQNLYALVSRRHPATNESAFIDGVAKTLRKGEFLLLIVGDGIREGAASIAEFLEANGTLHFTFGLVEMAIFRGVDGGFIIQPRVLAQSMIVKRTVVLIEDPRIVVQDGVREQEFDQELTELESFYRSFWKEFIGRLKLDDSSQPLPNVTKKGNIFFAMPPGSNGWITTYFLQSKSEVGLFLTFTRETSGDVIYERLVTNRSQIDQEIGEPLEWKSTAGKHTVTLRKCFSDLRSDANRKPIMEWLARGANLMVNAFRHRIERIVAEL